MAAKWDEQPKRWRVQGKATDGLTVTLGRYNTEEEAQSDCQKLTNLGGYRDIKVSPIDSADRPPPAPQRT